MIIGIEEGASGLWYGVSVDRSGPYKGLLIAGRSLDDVLDQISPTIKAMREAARKIAEEAIAPHLTKERAS